MDLIQEIVLQHGRSSPYKGTIPNASVYQEMENPLCGDTIRVDIKIRKGQITNMVFSGQGCLISQAAASLLIDKIIKVKSIAKTKKFNDGTVFKLLGFNPTLSRTKCALLILEVLKRALKNY